MADRKNRESASKALLPLTEAFFKEYTYSSWAIESYDQVLSVMGHMVSNQLRRSVQPETERDESVKIEFWFDDVRFSGPLSAETYNPDMPPIPTIAMRNDATYALTMHATFHAEMTLLPKENGKTHELTREVMGLLGKKIPDKAQEPTKHKITIPNGFRAKLPLMVKSKYCTLNSLEPNSTFQMGEDFNDPGGWFILNGKPFMVGGIYTYRYNYPVCVKTEHQDQLVRIEIIFREDVMYGTSYRLNPMITHSRRKVEVGKRNKIMRVFDIVFEMSVASPDVNETQRYGAYESANRLPIRALFFVYGCQSDREIVNFIFPGVSLSVDYSNFIQNVFEYGSMHVKLPGRLTRAEALLFIGGELMTSEAKKEKKAQADADAALYAEETDVPTETLSEMLYQSRMIDWTQHILDRYFMPNINDDPNKVCIQLGQLVSKMIRVYFDKEDETDRTALENKIIHLVGEQFLGEFRSQYNKTVVKELFNVLTQAIESTAFSALKESIEGTIAHKLGNLSTSLFNKMVDAFKNTTQKKGQPRLLGVAYDPKSAIFIWSKIREITIRPNAGERQASVQYSQRQMHPSYAGVICPDQTPEAGTDVGRYHQPALYTVINVAINPTPIHEAIVKIKSFNKEMPPHDKVADYYYVTLNWTIIGTVPRGEKAYAFYNTLLDLRRTDDDIDFRIGISIDHHAQRVNITTESGRTCVPFIKKAAVSDGKFKVYLQQLVAGKASWYDGFREGFIEYLDADMQNNAIIAEDVEDLVARSNECTHLMLPVGISGIISAINPASDRNKGVRGIYASNHVKQAIGWCLHNYISRDLGEINILDSPQKPLLYSAIYDILGLWRYAFGEHAVIAFIPFAKNQEDALVFNQGAVDRGAFMVHHLTVHASQTEGNVSRFGKKAFAELHNPIAKEMAYRKINNDVGIPTEIGTMINTGDVLVLKTRALKSGEIQELRSKTITAHDESELYIVADMLRSRHPMPARVAAVNPGSLAKDQRRSIKLSVTRRPTRGDKFSSIHAQKGTIGDTIPEEDMPYTEDGLRPTILFNDKAVLKRQTYGHVFDAILGKVCALLGTRLESTPFISHLSTADITSELASLGLSDRGLETMYDGVTGEPYETRIFVGVSYYIRQKHMVADKSYVRNGGPREGYSRQPTHGRNNGGGLKLGEMEGDAIAASGAAGVVRDCYHIRSAPYKTVICSICGGLGYPSIINPSMYHCDRCGELPSYINHELRTPFVLQLIKNTLGGASVSMKTILDKQDR